MAPRSDSLMSRQTAPPALPWRSARSLSSTQTRPKVAMDGVGGGGGMKMTAVQYTDCYCYGWRPRGRRSGR